MAGANLAQNNTIRRYGVEHYVDSWKEENKEQGRENREHGNGRMHTLLNERIGNDIPIKKPNKTPTKVVIISLILSFALLAKAL